MTSHPTHAWRTFTEPGLPGYCKNCNIHCNQFEATLVCGPTSVQRVADDWEAQQRAIHAPQDIDWFGINEEFK